MTTDTRIIKSNREKFQTEPENGHALLLMEAGQDQRTFSDYPDLITCLDTIIELYEQSRSTKGLDKDQYTLDDVWEWIDEFKRMDVFIFDKDIARYKRYRGQELRTLFRSTLVRL